MLFANGITLNFKHSQLCNSMVHAIETSLSIGSFIDHELEYNQ